MSHAVASAHVIRLTGLAIVAALALLLLNSPSASALPPTSPETPILAWAGQRVVVEHYWGDSAGVCPDFDSGAGDPAEFGVLYDRDSGPGVFTGGLTGNPNDFELDADHALVDVNRTAVDENFDGRTDPNSACISRVVYDSEDPGRVAIRAFAVDDNDSIGGFDVRSPDVNFVIYFLKFEDLTLGLVPGNRSGVTAGDFTPTTPPTFETGSDVTALTSNSSNDVLVRSHVRGWVVAPGCPVRASTTLPSGEILPANRCIFPDDWEFIAGGAGAEPNRPDFDIMKAPDAAFLPNSAGCQSPDRAAGPFSRLDRALVNLGPVTPAALCGDSLSLHASAGYPCRFGSGSCRESVLPDGDVDAADAPMPPSLVRLTLAGAGFMKGADKANVYPGNSNPFYVSHVPAEPWITPGTPIGGYDWNTWGTGAKSGLYRFWTSLADNGPEVMSCPGARPCPGDESPTGGYAMIEIYSDNHGEAMAWVNGDANLIEGESSLNAIADYPDGRKHPPRASSPADINWTVQVDPPDGGTIPSPVSVTFTSVTTPGVTTVELDSGGPPPPAGFSLGSPPVYYDISTTTVFSGAVTVCINYTGISYADEASLSLQHYDSSTGTWVDVTVSLDTVSNIICGSVTSFSPFALFEPATAVGGAIELLTSGEGGGPPRLLILSLAAGSILLLGLASIRGQRRRRL